MARKKGSTNYSLELKLEAIKLSEAGLTYAEVTERLNIRDPNRVKNWRWQYRREGVLGLKKPHRGRPPKRENTEAYIRRLEMENALLKKLHTELRREGLVKRNFGLSISIEKNTK
jgi:transposase-like protein